jgi:hypothetical protein
LVWTAGSHNELKELVSCWEYLGSLAKIHYCLQNLLILKNPKTPETSPDKINWLCSTRGGGSSKKPLLQPKTRRVGKLDPLSAY